MRGGKWARICAGGGGGVSKWAPAQMNTLVADMNTCGQGVHVCAATGDCLRSGGCIIVGSLILNITKHGCMPSSAVLNVGMAL